MRAGGSEDDPNDARRGVSEDDPTDARRDVSEDDPTAAGREVRKNEPTDAGREVSGDDPNTITTECPLREIMRNIDSGTDSFFLKQWNFFAILMSRWELGVIVMAYGRSADLLFL